MVALALFACGDEFQEVPQSPRCDATSGPCNVDPWVCAPGQTCSFNGAGDAFECFNVGAGQEGDACQALGGTATCGENLFCARLQGEAGGTCRRLCATTDPCKACPAGLNCTPVGSSAGEVLLCLPPP